MLNQLQGRLGPGIQAWARRLFSLTEGVTSLAPELQASLVTENDRAEGMYLKGELLGGVSAAAAALAGSVSGLVFTPPAGRIYVLTSLKVGATNAGRIILHNIVTSLPSAVQAALAPSVGDQRWGDIRPALQVTTFTEAGAITGRRFAEAIVVAAAPLEEILPAPLVLVSPFTALVYHTTANTAVTAAARWYERALFEMER